MVWHEYCALWLLESFHYLLVAFFEVDESWGEESSDAKLSPLSAANSKNSGIYIFPVCGMKPPRSEGVKAYT
jgi:hypothetical protein